MTFNFIDNRDHGVLIPFKKVFLGGCFGVGLYPRGKNDSHVSWIALVEDDDYWHISQNGGSSFWLPDQMHAFQAAITWCEQNCDQDRPKTLGGAPCGWKFRDGAIEDLVQELD